MTFKQLAELVRAVHLARRALDGRQAVERLAELRAQHVHVDAGLREQAAHGAALLLEQRGHQVHGLDELVIAADGERLRVLQRLLELGRQLVHSHERFGPEFADRPEHEGSRRDSNGYRGNHVHARALAAAALGRYQASQISVAIRPHGASRRCEKKRCDSVNVQNPPPATAVTPGRRSGSRARGRRGPPASGRAAFGAKKRSAAGSCATYASRTSAPTSYAAAPIAGPSQATISRGSDAERSHGRRQHAVQ